MTRPARVIIDLAALRHNYSRVQQLASGSRVVAVVKADAYGHGIVRVARALEDADAFGVACMEEAAQLRTAGISKRILLLEGPYSTEELAAVAELHLDIVVHHESQLQMLQQANVQGELTAWLKIDSGMHRLGFDPAEVPAVLDSLQSTPCINDNIIMMTHLATANEPGNEMNQQQLQTFRNAINGYQGECSIANSAATISFAASHGDWVRPGLMLYGVSPLEDAQAGDHDLRPVMTLRSQLISVKRIRQGESVGYGASWRCPSDTTIGIVAAGYGDGFPRHARSGTPTLVNGKRATIIGNASMDMLTVDLSAQPGAQVGDEVELWGSALPIEEVAMYADTVPYELLCGVHKRLTFEEINGQG